MAKDPAFLFYASDFLTGVQDLTFEERGQYITLLCIEHQKGRLSDKLIKLSVGNATADVMAKFKQDENGLFYNERLEQEIEKRKKHSEKQRDRALEGWKKRKNGQNHGNATAMPLENENENRIINKNISVDEVKEYFNKNGYSAESAVKFFNYYSVANWCDAKGKKVKNWKQKAQSVWFKPENELKPVSNVKPIHEQLEEMRGF